MKLHVIGTIFAAIMALSAFAEEARDLPAIDTAPPKECQGRACIGATGKEGGKRCGREGREVGCRPKEWCLDKPNVKLADGSTQTVGVCVKPHSTVEDIKLCENLSCIKSGKDGSRDYCSADGVVQSCWSGTYCDDVTNDGDLQQFPVKAACLDLDPKTVSTQRPKQTKAMK